MEPTDSKRRKPNGWPSILSLSSVLFLLGLVGFSLLGFQGLSERLIESNSIDVYFDETSSSDDIAEFQRSLEREDWVKTTKFISREEGLRQMGQKFADYQPKVFNEPFLLGMAMAMVVVMAMIMHASKLLRQNFSRPPKYSFQVS